MPSPDSDPILKSANSQPDCDSVPSSTHSKLLLVLKWVGASSVLVPEWVNATSGPVPKWIFELVRLSGL